MVSVLALNKLELKDMINGEMVENPVLEEIEELVAAIAPTVTWWQACDMPAVWAWAQTEARCQLITEYLAGVGGDLDEVDDLIRPAAELLTRLQARAESMRSEALAGTKAKAGSRSTTMVIPIVLLGAGFLLLLIFPTVYRMFR